MARLQVIEYPDSRLRLSAEPVMHFDADLARLAADLIETLHDSGAIGLSAPQVNAQLQLLVMDLSGNQSDPQIYINPEILERSKTGLVEESCLSLPGVVVNAFRPTQVRVRAQDAEGATFERELEGMPAVCLQHEMDHFDGRLLLDRVSFIRRWRIRAKLNKHAATRAGDAPARGAADKP